MQEEEATWKQTKGHVGRPRLSGRAKLDGGEAKTYGARTSATLPVMPGKRSFEDQVAAVDALRHQPEEARVEPLRKALAHRNNFIVAKAADLVREFHMAHLMPELLSAFVRFFDNPVKTDPQCWAKNALSRTLFALEHQETAVYLRGMRHI